jgi:hypothetical protein
LELKFENFAVLKNTLALNLTPFIKKIFMKKYLLALLMVFSFTSCETAKSIMDSVGNGNLTNTEVVQGLKEALQLGTDSATFHLALLNGFYKDDMIKILMPPEAQSVEKSLRNVGLGSLVDKAVLSMNRAAEDATKYVGNIFLNAIKQMTIQDAFGILRGGDRAATDYLKQKTSAQLTAAFTPIVSKSLDYTDATKYWKDIFTAYNKFSNKPVNTDLTAYFIISDWKNRQSVKIPLHELQIF